MSTDPCTYCVCSSTWLFLSATYLQRVASGLPSLPDRAVRSAVQPVDRACVANPEPELHSSSLHFQSFSWAEPLPVLACFARPGRQLLYPASLQVHSSVLLIPKANQRACRELHHMAAINKTLNIHDAMQPEIQRAILKVSQQHLNSYFLDIFKYKNQFK